MASIEEVRSGIALANQKASESLGALQQAHSQLEEAQQSLTRVTEGSAQADVHDATAQLQQAAQSISEVQQLVHSAISTAEGISQRL
jgi:replicative DNA helicase